jgi:hypothetical protein
MIKQVFAKSCNYGTPTRQSPPTFDMEMSDAANGNVIIYGGEDGDVFRHSFFTATAGSRSDPFRIKISKD